MVKMYEYQRAKYKYETMDEMTEHIKTMGDAGWSITAVYAVALVALFRKKVI